MHRLHELRSHVLRPVLEQNHQRVLSCPNRGYRKFTKQSRQYVGKDAARELLMNLAHVLRTWMNEQMRKSPTIGIMIDESTDIRKVKVATAQFLIIASA